MGTETISKPGDADSPAGSVAQTQASSKITGSHEHSHGALKNAYRNKEAAEAPCSQSEFRQPGTVEESSCASENSDGGATSTEPGRMMQLRRLRTIWQAEQARKRAEATKIDPRLSQSQVIDGYPLEHSNYSWEIARQVETRRKECYRGAVDEAKAVHEQFRSQSSGVIKGALSVLEWFTQVYENIGDRATEMLETEVALSRVERHGLEAIVEAAEQLEDKLGDLHDWYLVQINKEFGWAKQHAKGLDQQLEAMRIWTWNTYKSIYPDDRHNEYSGLKLYLSDWAEVIDDGKFLLDAVQGLIWAAEAIRLKLNHERTTWENYFYPKRGFVRKIPQLVRDHDHILGFIRARGKMLDLIMRDEDDRLAMIGLLETPQK